MRRGGLQLSRQQFKHGRITARHRQAVHQRSPKIAAARPALDRSALE
jgi:hypothetical protein